MSDINRNKAIDAWRFLFALLIIWHHLPWVDGHVHALGYCAVSFFLIASGFLSASSDTSDLRKYYIRKFFRIFPIYWIALLVALIETVPIRSAWTPAAVWDILQHVFLLQAYSAFEVRPMFYYLNPPMWFLCVLVLFYILLPLLQRWQRKSPTGFAIGVIGWSMAAVSVTWIGFDGIYGLRVNMPLVRISECLLGMVLASCLKDKYIADIHKYISIFILVLFFIFAYYIPNEYIRPYLSIPIMAYLFVAFLQCKENRLLSYVSKWGGGVWKCIYSIILSSWDLYVCRASSILSYQWC